MLHIYSSIKIRPNFNKEDKQKMMFVLYALFLCKTKTQLFSWYFLKNNFQKGDLILGK